QWVEKSISLNGRRACVRQQRKCNATLPAEGGQYFGWIVAYCSHSPALLLHVLQAALQFDQLRFAIGSPIRRTEEDEHCSFGSQDRLQRPDRAILIFEAEI